MPPTTGKNAAQLAPSSECYSTDESKDERRQRIVWSNDTKLLEFMKDAADDDDIKKRKRDYLRRRHSSMGELTATTASSSFSEDDISDELDEIPSPEIDEYEQERIKLHEFMVARAMTPLQEKWNALTMIPNVIFCFYYLHEAKWIPDDMKGEITDECTPPLPPMTILACIVGIIIHFPFSFIFHWCYASTLPPGIERLDHWSRRADQMFIHAVSALWAYTTSGSLYYFAASAIFNAICMQKQWLKKIDTKGNKIRILIAVFMYIMPILCRGEVLLFVQVLVVLTLGFWLFAAYPIGGWSHCGFHIVNYLLPPLILTASMTLPSNKEDVILVAKCAVL